MRVEYLLLSPHHEVQGAVNGLGFAAGYRRVQHFHTLTGQNLGNFLGGDGIDGRAVDKHSAGLHIGGDTILAQHDLPDLRGVGQHGDHHIAAFADFFGGRGNGTVLDTDVDSSLAAVPHQDMFIPFPNQVVYHGLAHDPKTDESNRHSMFSLSFIL